MNLTRVNKRLHPRNLHLKGYDFAQLAEALPALKPHLRQTPKGTQSIDFSSPSAVKLLNAALLKHHYGVEHWDIPEGFLCPGVPGRADYIHHIADLLGIEPQTQATVGLDVGTGANLIYPLLGHALYKWRFIASELNQQALNSARTILAANAPLHKRIGLRQAANPSDIFSGVIKPTDRISFTMCNPPFHSDAASASRGTQKKNKNLARHASKRHAADSTVKNTQKSNFGGQHNELWCEGGELAFITHMINQSQEFAEQVTWFTCLVSKKDNVALLEKQLHRIAAKTVKIVPMQQGAKQSRFIAWRFC